MIDLVVNLDYTSEFTVLMSTGELQFIRQMQLITDTMNCIALNQRGEAIFGGSNIRNTIGSVVLTTDGSSHLEDTDLISTKFRYQGVIDVSRDNDFSIFIANREV